jgi:serine/threonine protein phosphatase PrpC
MKRFLSSNNGGKSSSLLHIDDILNAAPIFKKHKRPSAAHGGVLRFKIAQSPQVCGIRSTRGNREVNEDRYQRSLIRLGEQDAVYLAVFDGHGGSRASDYCSAHLHSNIEAQYRSLMRTNSANQKDDPSLLELGIQRAFIETDRSFLATHSTESLDGTTASVCILQNVPEVRLDDGSQSHVTLTVGHVGDSRILLCGRDGKARQISVDHHPSVPEEHDRIIQNGGFIERDAFGDDALMGMSANSRAIGVARLKHWKGKGCGLTAEPLVKMLHISNWDLFLVLLTDGITTVMTNQEVVDLVKYYKDPTSAAIGIVDYAEQCGTRDNSTALVLRLAGWPLSQSLLSITKDFSLNRRRYRLGNSVGGRSDASSNLGQDESGEYAVVPYEQAIIDLFDTLGKDIGSAAFLEDASYSSSVRSIGRLSSSELLRSIQSSGLIIWDSEKGDALDPHEVVDHLFHTSWSDADEVEEPLSHGRALSAADLLKAFKNATKWRLLRAQK